MVIIMNIVVGKMVENPKYYKIQRAGTELVEMKKSILAAFVNEIV